MVNKDGTIYYTILLSAYHLSPYHSIVLTILVLTNFFLGEWEWLGPGSTHGGRLTGPALFGAWEILGYGFQDMVFRTWDLNFGAWKILGYGF